MVEDNEGDFVLIQEYLFDENPLNNVSHANSLKKATEKLSSEETFDVILLDLSLPDASGQQLVETIVKMSVSTPVVILTGLSDRDFGVKALSLGVSDYLQKDELSSHLLSKSISYSIERSRINKSLKYSEQQYRDLFEFNPLPMWVFDAKSLAFLNVNEAAIRHYGYKRDEFLSMSILDIRPKDDIETLYQSLKNTDNRASGYSETTTRHLKKNGDLIRVKIQASPIIFNGKKAELILAIDITDQLKKEAITRETLERYDIVAKATSDAIWDVDLEHGTTLYNQVFFEMFGYNPNDIEHTPEWWLSCIHPDDYEMVMNELNEFLRSENLRVQQEYRFRCADGSYKYVNDRAFIVTDSENRPVRMIGAMQDISQKKTEENRLRLLESVIVNANDAVIISEPNPKNKYERTIIYINEAFERMTGFTKGEVIGKRPGFLSGPRTDTTEKELIEKNLEKGLPTVNEFINYKKNGEEFWVNQSTVPLFNEKGDYTHCITIKRDITERKNYEDAILRSLREKETLLAEIHHRVKNNLAIVSSMMQLQTYHDEENLELRQKLLDSVSRIQTMAIIHEHLYQSNSFSTINFPENLQRLIKNIIDTFNINTDVKLNFQHSPAFLNINQAIPCSLIVNEVVTNTLKHAFQEKSEGRLTVNLSTENDHLFLSIADDGSGFPDNFDFQSEETLGMMLIRMLTEQLEGTFSYEKASPGTIFTLRFELKPDLAGSGSSII